MVGELAARPMRPSHGDRVDHVGEADAALDIGGEPQRDVLPYLGTEPPEPHLPVEPIRIAEA